MRKEYEKPQTVVYVGAWEVAYVCAECGEYLSSSITDSHWGKPCHRCGQVGAFCPESIQTSRRFVCTKKRWFKPDLGYYEWSGKSLKGAEISAHPAMAGKIISTTAVTIAAAGVASGLF